MGGGYYGVMRFFTSDHHFGHRNIARLAGRPFPDSDDGVVEMNETMIARHNAVVSPDDDVYILGDIAMGRIDDSLALVGRLNGRLHLIGGNHDRCWPIGHVDGVSAKDARKAADWIDRYLDAGFEAIHDALDLVLSDGTNVHLNHFPYAGDSHDQDRYRAARPVDDGRWLLHGHVHEKWQQNGRQINVGVDAWDFAPVAEDRLVALIGAGPGPVQ